MKRICICAAFFALASLVAGCGKERAQAHEAHTAEDNESQIAQVQTWHVSQNRVVILFGYGYNDSEFVEKTLEALYEKYGEAEDGGLIIPLIFPKDFKKGKDSIASELPIYATKDGGTLRGVLLLGAGENTNYGIAHLQDYFGGERAFPVFSLFPQDDVLGTEATSDFVLERVQETDVAGGEEENGQVFVPEVEGMIERSMEYFCAMADISSCPWESEGAPQGVSLPWDEELQKHVASIAAPLEVARYVDGETGLQSVNHFVIEEK